MPDSEDAPNQARIPSWKGQKPESMTPPQTRETRLVLARRFLRDPEVTNSSREKKVEFLKTKGLEGDEIDKLLEEEASASSEPQETQDDEQKLEDPEHAHAEPADSLSPQYTTPPKTSDRPPVVTYPEFLTKPSKPPPLITPSNLLTSLYAFGALSTLLYGTSKCIISPMVDTLTDARLSLHASTKHSLSTLVQNLEGIVSEQPASSARIEDPDADDPSELFHRDVGTQTSTPPTPAFGLSSSEKDMAERQAQQVVSLVASLQELRDDIVTQTEDLQDVGTHIDVFGGELEQMTGAANSSNDFVGQYSLYGPRRTEPDDEIKHSKEMIRRVKGLLLSTRNFPASTR